MAETAEQVLARLDARYSPHMAAQNARAAHVAHPRYRTDLWVRCFDGAAYRFWLTPDQLARLEQEFAYTDQDGQKRSSGIVRVFGAVAKGRYEIDGKSIGFAAEGQASVSECRRIITEALIGGKVAFAEGRFVTIDRSQALALVEAHLSCAPVEESWSLAFAILNVVIHGRPHTEAEKGHPSSMPVSPGDGDVIELASAADLDDTADVDMRL